ncbi:MAG: hypothetical protein ACOYLX_14505 [Burkholderiaceae bacterium]
MTVSTSSSAGRTAAQPRRTVDTTPSPGRFQPATARRTLATITAIVALSAPISAQSEWITPDDQLRVSYGPYAWHFNESTEHVRYNHLISVELLTPRWRFWGADRTQIGFAVFDNSFGQPSQYLYFGQEWDLGRFLGGTGYVNATAGLLHGYKDEYQDKIPFNRYGTAPVIIPSIGVRWGSFAVLATALGLNGFLFAASYQFDLR